MCMITKWMNWVDRERTDVAKYLGTQASYTGETFSYHHYVFLYHIYIFILYLNFLNVFFSRTVLQLKIVIANKSSSIESASFEQYWRTFQRSTSQLLATCLRLPVWVETIYVVIPHLHIFSQHYWHSLTMQTHILTLSTSMCPSWAAQ